MSRPEMGGGRVTWGIDSRITGRITSAKLGKPAGSFAAWEICWVGELKLLWAIAPRGITQEKSSQDFTGPFEPFLQQQLGSAKKPISTLLPPAH